MILARIFAHLSLLLLVFPAAYCLSSVVSFVSLFVSSPSVCVFPQPFFSTCSYLCLFIPFHVTVIRCDTLLCIFPFRTSSCMGRYDYSVTFYTSSIIFSFFFFTQLARLLHNQRIPGDLPINFGSGSDNHPQVFPIGSLPAESCLLNN
ncbi:hypothetical protein EDB92DRAFT_379987 [Lactarius akahatsu]|uniref:Secreted peptide n=1 Tax=Lactarius akahatsu TaxID=416441 RepID=A0AAD4LI86_9AGAM|nr:hypothetical protein EDB92DRAFT_379987 [Lactarius akahatsu]